MFGSPIRTALRAVAVGGALATASILVPATAAHADNVMVCTSWYDYNGVEFFSVNCVGGHHATDQYRAVVMCERPGGTQTVTRTGPWLHSGTSTAACPSAYDAYGGWAQKA